MRTNPIVSSIILGAGLVSLGCGASKTNGDTQPKPADVVEQPADTAPAADPEPAEPAEPAAKVVELGPGQTAITVAPGTVLRYSFKSYASVGYGAEYELDDSGAVVYVRTDTDYEQTEAERAGKTGADAATGTFVFEAREVGTASLQVRALFRGTVESEAEYTITVVATGD